MREASPSSSSEVDDSCFMDFARRRLWIQSDSNLLSHPNANFHYLVVFDHLTANLFSQRVCLSKRTRSFVWTFSLKLIVALELVRVCARLTQTQSKENFNFFASPTSFSDVCVCLWLNFPPNNVACDGEFLPKTEEESRDDGANSAASSHRQQQ